MTDKDGKTWQDWQLKNTRNRDDIGKKPSSVPYVKYTFDQVHGLTGMSRSSLEYIRLKERIENSGPTTKTMTIIHDTKGLDYD